MFSRSLVSYRRLRPVGEVSGFGLVELLVSISIVLIVVSVILVQQGAFNSAVLLRDQAYEVALQMREVQLSAVSASGDIDFRSTMGLYITSESPHNDHIHVFRDLNGNGFYDTGEEWGQAVQFDRQFAVREIRVGSETPNRLSVVFERPNFDARFFSAPNTEYTTESVAEIDIALVGADESSVDGVRTVEVTRTGQIAVE